MQTSGAYLNSFDRFRPVLFKLAVFTVILLLNNKLLFYIFVYPAALILNATGSTDNYEIVYLVSWLTNDVGSYLIPAVSAVLLFKEERKDFSPYPEYMPALEIPVIMAASYFVGSLASAVVDFIADILDKIIGTGQITDAMEDALPSEGETGSFIWFLVFVIILAPICEELIFRKLLLQPLRNIGDGFAVVVSSLLFGACHGNFDQFPYAFAVGCLYGILAVRSGKLLPTIALHLVNNLLVAAAKYLPEFFDKTEWADNVSFVSAFLLNALYYAGIIALVLFAVLKLHKTKKNADFAEGEFKKLLFYGPSFYIFIIAAILLLV